MVQSGFGVLQKTDGIDGSEEEGKQITDKATIQELVNLATRMVQELQEFVEEAIESCDDKYTLKGTQYLIEEWESIYKRLNKL